MQNQIRWSVRGRADRLPFGAIGPVCLLLALSLLLGGCGTKQTLREAVQCDAFHRNSDGTWSTSKDVSLDYVQGGTRYQLNLSKGVTLTGKIANQAPELVSTLEGQCATK
jgi:hypothetical protein